MKNASRTGLLLIVGVSAILAANGPPGRFLQGLMLARDCRCSGSVGGRLQAQPLGPSDAFAWVQEEPVWSKTKGLLRRVSFTTGFAYEPLEQDTWPDGIIAYIIDPGVDENLINAAIDHFHTRTNIRFVKSGPEGFGIPIYPTTGDEDLASVGDLGLLGVYIAPWSTLPDVIHEFGHVVGLLHEHQRTDRDQFIEVNQNNIAPEYLWAFEVMDKSTSDIGEYDFLSVMHYSSLAGSVNGQPTMTKLDGSLIGINQGLSAGDIAAIEALYPELGPSPIPAVPTPPPIPIVVQPPPNTNPPPTNPPAHPKKPGKTPKRPDHKPKPKKPATGRHKPHGREPKKESAFRRIGERSHFEA
jgi:hypothetical protein